MNTERRDGTAVSADAHLEAILYDWECRQFLRRQLGDVRFYKRHAQGRVLELACGTGRVTEALLDAGHPVTALDVHSGMLAQARKRLGERASLVEADMRQFELASQFDTVVIAYNSFQLLHSLSDQEACLRRIREHLVPGGRLLFEVTPFLLRDPPSDWSHRATAHLHADPTIAGDGTVVSAWERCRTRPSAQLNHFDVRYELFGTDGTRLELHHTLTLRTIFRFELELLLTACGFAVERIDGDYDGTPLEACEDEGMVVSARTT